MNQTRLFWQIEFQHPAKSKFFDLFAIEIIERTVPAKKNIFQVIFLFLLPNEREWQRNLYQKTEISEKILLLFNFLQNEFWVSFRFSGVVKTTFWVSWETFRTNFSWNFCKHFWEIRAIFSPGSSKLHYRCPEEHFDRKENWENFLIFFTFSELCAETILSWVVKTAFHGSVGTFWANIFSFISFTVPGRNWQIAGKKLLHTDKIFFS